MKVSKRQLKRIIREEKARILTEQDLEARRVDPIQETNAAYDLISDLVTDELHPGPHGQPAGRERIQAWISALQSVIKDLQTEMPPRDESEFITLRDPSSGDPEVFESRNRRLRRLIREAREPMTPDYVYSSLMAVQDFGPRKGLTRMQMAMDAIATGDFIGAVNRVEDALWIDDPPPGAEEELANLIAGVRSEDELAAIAAEWGTRHFRSHR